VVSVRDDALEEETLAKYSDVRAPEAAHGDVRPDDDRSEENLHRGYQRTPRRRSSTRLKRKLAKIEKTRLHTLA